MSKILLVSFLLIGSGLLAKGSSKACYKVEGMTCKACTVTLKAAVNKLDGIESVKSSSREKNATVVYDPSKTDADAIEKQIDSTGYRASQTACQKG